jgi:hypothetical protein
MGGLSALNVVHELSRLLQGTAPKYLAYVTFGAPFGGTGYLADKMLRRVPLGYVQRLFEKELTLRYFRELLDFSLTGELSVMLHSIERDEFISANSALLPSDWLYFASMPEGALPGLRWGAYEIETRRRFRSHDSLLSNPLALAYIDGVVDGLLPPG